MRFSEILSEDYSNEPVEFGDPEKNPEPWQHFINECSEAVAACKDTGKFMWRALSEPTPTITWIGTSPTNRKPRDASAMQQEIYDDILKAAGCKALRSNSIFVTSCFNSTEEYGANHYMIFPVNGFNYTYTNFHDLIWADTHSGDDWKRAFVTLILSKGGTPPGKWMRLATDDRGQPLPKPTPEQVKNAFDYVMAEIGPTPDSNLRGAIESEREILIHGRYYAFEYAAKWSIEKLMKLI